MRTTLLVIALLFSSPAAAAAQSAWTLTMDAAAEHSAGKTAAAIAKLRHSLRMDSSLIDTYVLLGQIYLETDSLALAESVLRKALGRKRTDPRIYHVLGSVAFTEGRYRNSIQLFTQVLNIEYNSHAQKGLAMSHLNRGVELSDEGRLEPALRHFESAIEADRSNRQAYRNRIIVLSRLGRLAEAERAATEAVGHVGGDKELLGMLVQLRQKEKDFPGALEAARQLYRLTPDDVNAGLQLAYLYRFNNQGDASIDVYESLLNRSPIDKRVYDEYADLHTARGDYQLAEAVYRRLLALKPGDQTVLQDVGALRAKAKDYAGSRQAYRQALLDGPPTPQIYHRIAQAYIDEDRPTDAVATYRAGVDQLPTDRSLFISWGRILESLEPAESVGVYERMINARPSDPFPHVRLGVVFAETESSRARSEEQFREAIRLGTVDPIAYHSLARFSALDADTAAAIDHEREAVEMALQKAELLKARLLSEMGGGMQSLSESQLHGIETAADSLRQVEEILRESLAHFLSLGTASDRESDLRQLEDTFEDAGILLEYRGRLLEQAGWLDEAEATYTQLLASEPDNKFAQLALARIWENEGDVQRAVTAYRRALVLDDRNQEIYDRLVGLHVTDKRLGGLMDEWLIRARRSPGNRVLLENLVRLLETAGRTSDLDYVQALLDNLGPFE